MAAKILLIADDINILRTLRRNLIDRGYEVTIAIDDQHALEATEQILPDLVVLNLYFKTPNINGLNICNQIRQLSLCPIIVLTTIGAEEDKIKALDLGVDDCLDMPFNIEEFMARVRSALRRWFDYLNIATKKGHLILCSDLVINIDSREVTLRGEPIKLTRTEFEILRYLAEHSGVVVTHSELLKAVWGPMCSGEKIYLRVYISSLRRKIETNPLNPKLILTEPGVGYRLVVAS